MGRKKVLVFSVLMFVIAGLLYTYFFIISPTFVAKPQIEKPTLAEGQPVEPKHVQWLVNELGAYKLHNPPFSGKIPEMEMLVTTDNKYFTVTVKQNFPEVSEGRATNPDIRISGSREVVAKLLAAGDIIAEAKKLSDEGKIKLDILKDMTELAAMGYKALYDELG